MAFTLISSSGKVSYNIKEILADTSADLPVDGIAVGSKAYVINLKKWYIFNSSYAWVELGGQASSSN